MKHPSVLLLIAGFASLQVMPFSRATDLIVDGNTIVSGKVGVGMGANSVPSKALEIEQGSLNIKVGSTNQSIAFQNTWWAGAGFKAIYEYQHDNILIYPTLQQSSYWPEFTIYLKNDGYLLLGPHKQGRLSVHQRPSDSYAFSVNTTWSTVQPTIGWFNNNQIAFTQRLATTSLNQLQFNISPALGQTPATALEIHPSTNVLIGANVVPAAKLHVVGNIIAANPTAPTHVVTKQWLEAGQWRIQPQGDISMGDFTATPTP